MATALARQLKQLSTPQTSALIQTKKVPSLLFDPKEAANLDRDSVFAIGLSGLEELKCLNPEFGQFELTLFQQRAIALQRAVEPPEVIVKLDANIVKFLRLVSPYFLLKPAQKALEWLVYRYYIHQYNTDTLIMCIIPYHDTLMFVRAIQLITKITDPANRWHWLHPLQKAGVPLPKTTLLNHCIQNSMFLKTICDHVFATVQVHELNGPACQTIISFYCTTIVGALDHAPKVTEQLLSLLVPYIGNALTSSYPNDMVAATFMIMAQITSKSRITEKLALRFVQLIIKQYQPAPELGKERVLLMATLYHMLQLNVFPKKVLPCLIYWTKFSCTLGELSELHDVRAVFQSCVLALVQSYNLKKRITYYKLIQNLIADVKLTKPNACIFINAVISSYNPDDYIGEDKRVLIAVKTRYQFVMMRMSEKYPEAYDSAVGESFKTLQNADTPDNKELKKLRELIGLSGRNANLDTGSMFEMLYHPNAEIRSQAVATLIEQQDGYKYSSSFISETLLERFQDDSPQVVEQVIDIGLERLLHHIPLSTLVSNLVSLLRKRDYGKRKLWKKVCKKTIVLLGSKTIVDSESRAHVLLRLIPCLCPTKPIHMTLVQEVLKTDLAKESKLLTTISQKLIDAPVLDDSSIQPEQVCGIVFRTLAYEMDGMTSVERESVLTHMRESVGTEGKVIDLLLDVIMLGPVLSSEEDTTQRLKLSMELVRHVQTIVDNYKMKAAVGVAGDINLLGADNICECFKVAKSKRPTFPLQILLHLLTIIHMNNNETAFFLYKSQLTGGIEYSDQLWLSVIVYRVLTSGERNVNLEGQKLYKDCRKVFLLDHFGSSEIRLRFLSCMWNAGLISNRDREVKEDLQVAALTDAALYLQESENSIVWTLDGASFVVPCLLVSLVSQSQNVRKAALQCLKVCSLSVGAQLSSGNYYPLVEFIMKNQQEIETDPTYIREVVHDFFSPLLVNPSKLQADKKTQLECTYTALVDNTLLNEDLTIHLKYGLLKVLDQIQSQTLFRSLVPIATQILSSAVNRDSLGVEETKVMSLIISRINETTCDCLSDGMMWEFFTTCLTCDKIVTCDEVTESVTRKKVPLQLFVINQVTSSFFKSLPSQELQKKVFYSLINLATESQVPGVSLQIQKLLKHLAIDGSLVVNELTKIHQAARIIQEKAALQTPLKRKRTRPISEEFSAALIESSDWRRTLVLLEMLQNKKKVSNPQIIIRPLFQVLKSCVEMEDQSCVEYGNQLLLSCIYHCCEKLMEEDTNGLSEVKENELKKCLSVDILVECIQSSRSPQTHQHALLLLALATKIMPDTVLHNMMSIFTFMGTSVLRQDDSYSAQVISKIIHTILPILVKSPNKSKNEINKLVIMVMRVFANALIDIPVHRRIPLFTKVVASMDSGCNLWLMLLLIVEKGVGNTTESTSSDGNKASDFAVTLAVQFEPEIIINNCCHIINYLIDVSDLKDDRSHTYSLRSKEVLEDTNILFDIEKHSSKDVRHYIYLTVTFLSQLLASEDYITKSLDVDLQDLYQRLIAVTLKMAQKAGEQAEENRDKPTNKYWKVLLSRCYDLLDKVISFIPSDTFIKVIVGLLTEHHTDRKLWNIERKSLEILNSKLHHHQTHTFFQPEDHSLLLTLLTPLVTVVGVCASDDESVLNQQTALFSVKLLAKTLASEYPHAFIPVLECTTVLCERPLLNPRLLSSALLCLAELCRSLKEHTISLANRFVSRVTSVLQDTDRLLSNELLLYSCATCVHKLLESLPLFLSKHVVCLLENICLLCARSPEKSSSKVISLQQRLKATRHVLATSIPHRILFPAISTSYLQLYDSNHPFCIQYLMDVLSSAISTLSKDDMAQYHNMLTDLFIKVLDYRCTSSCDLDTVWCIEGSVINSLVTMVMKMSETTFKPTFYKIYEWATREEDHPDRLITFYRLSHSIGERLKGLFALFASHFLRNSSQLLDNNNTTKNTNIIFSNTKFAEKKCQLLIQCILNCLNTVFLHDNDNFLTRDRFDLLMQPLVDQMECASINPVLSPLLQTTITHFTSCSSDDAMWKMIQYRILLKSRNTQPQVRLYSLDVLCSVADKLGSDFIMLLPEAVPFLSELLEDEDEEVEKRCRNVIQNIEQIVGEPLQKYF